MPRREGRGAAGTPRASGRGRGLYRTVFETGARLTGLTDPDGALWFIVREVGKALDVRWCDINEYDAEARVLRYLAVWSRHLRKVDLDYVGTVVSLDERPGRDAVLRKGDVLVQYADDPHLDPLEAEVMRKYDEWAVMEVPLVYGGQPIGILSVMDSREGRRFSEEEVELFRRLAEPAAVAMGNARAFAAVRRRERQATALLASSRALVADSTLDGVLADVTRLAVEAVQASQGAVYEYRPERDSIVYRAVHCRVPVPTGAADDPLGTEYRLDDYPGERAALQAGRLIEERQSDPALPADRRESMVRWGEKTCLTVPLRFGDHTLGLLRLYEMERERAFGEEERQVLAAFGELAAAAVHTARLLEEEDERRRRLHRLLARNVRGLTTLEPDAVAAWLAGGVAEQFREPVATAVWWRDPFGEDLVPLAAGGSAGEPPGEAAVALADGAVLDRQTASGAQLVVPLRGRRQPVGVLVVEVAGRRAVTASEREAVEVLANRAAAALTNARLLARLREQAVRDGLTGLANHRHFQERLRQECARARRYGLPLALLMIDLDDFKAYNDRYGHQLGDQALRELADILASSTRRGIDLPARYGGEEFAVILPHTSASAAAVVAAAAAPAGDEAPPPPGPGACVVAERLRAAVAAHRFAGHGGRREVRLTVTVGVAGSEGEAADPERLLAAADRALYEGKRAGKDRVVAAP